MQFLGLGDVTRADQHRLAGLVHLGDVFDQRGGLGGDRDVHPVGFVLADVGFVRRYRRHPELVELSQLFAGGQRGAGHAAHSRIPVDQRLHGDGVEHFTGLGGLDPLLGLHRGLQPVRPALQGRDATARGVDQVDRVVPDDVVHVALQQHVGVQGDVDLGQRRTHVLLGVQVDTAQRGFQLACAGIGQMHVAAVGIAGEVAALLEVTDHADELDPRCLPVAGAGQHQRDQRLVDEHGVRFVDERDVGVRRDQIGHVGDQLVAQHVEADLVDRGVGDVALVGGATLLGGRLRGDPADRQAQRLDQRSHPLGVTAGQVVVDRDDVHVATGQRIPGGRDGPRQRLAFTGGHLDDVTGEHPQCAEQLDIERAQAGGALGGLAGYREELRDVLRIGQVLELQQRGRLAHLLVAEVGGLGGELLGGAHLVHGPVVVLFGAGAEHLPKSAGQSSLRLLS